MNKYRRWSARPFASLMSACLLLAAMPVTARAAPLTGSFRWMITGYDWGPAVNKIILDLSETFSAGDFDSATFAVRVNTTNRPVTAAYPSDAYGNRVSGSSSCITLELLVAQNVGSPFTYNFMTGLNTWTTPYSHTVSLAKTLNGYTAWNVTDAGKYTPEYDQFFRSSFTQGSVTMQYAYYEPPAGDGKRPLVIWVHGAGEGGSDPAITLYGNKVVNLASSEIQACFGGAYLLAPQSPTMWMNRGDGQYTTNGTSMYTAPLMNLIKAFVDANPNIDKRRIYLGGCSNGGFMTMNLLLYEPEYFAAAYPICEAYNSSWITDAQIQSIKDIPIWFTQATNDSTVNYSNTTRATFNRLIAAGAKDMHCAEFPNAPYNSHWSWIYVLNNQAPCTANASTLLSNCTGGCGGVTIMDWLASHALPSQTYNVTGLVRAYNPNNPATVKLMRDGEEKYGTAIEAEPGFGQVTQLFTFMDVEPGAYTLVVSKPAHTSFTVQTVTVGDTDLDLTRDGRDAVKCMTLLCGDINGDQMINDNDLIALWQAANYNKNVEQAANSLCDLNGDGVINDNDLIILWLAVNYNKGPVVAP